MNIYSSVEDLEGGGRRYRIGIIADLDKDSRHRDGYWVSYLLRGHLTRDTKGMYSIAWDEEPQLLKSYFAENGRGLELSELQFFNGVLCYHITHRA